MGAHEHGIDRLELTAIALGQRRVDRRRQIAANQLRKREADVAAKQAIAPACPHSFRDTIDIAEAPIAVEHVECIADAFQDSDDVDRHCLETAARRRPTRDVPAEPRPSRQCYKLRGRSGSICARTHSELTVSYAPAGSRPDPSDEMPVRPESSASMCSSPRVPWIGREISPRTDTSSWITRPSSRTRPLPNSGSSVGIAFICAIAARPLAIALSGPIATAAFR